MDLTVKIDTSKFEKTIKRKLQRVEHMQPLMDRIAADMLKETQLNFRNEQSPEKISWEKLKESTLANRRKEGRGAKILQDTGQLLQSIHSKSKATKNNAFALVGTNLKDKNGYSYPKKHQFGKGKIPARPFIGFNKTMKERYMKWINDYLKS